jgi:hypothetical protein
MSEPRKVFLSYRSVEKERVRPTCVPSPLKPHVWQTAYARPAERRGPRRARHANQRVRPIRRAGRRRVLRRTRPFGAAHPSHAVALARCKLDEKRRGSGGHQPAKEEPASHWLFDRMPARPDSLGLCTAASRFDATLGLFSGERVLAHTQSFGRSSLSRSNS